MVNMGSFSGKDVRPAINTNATNIPKAPYTWLPSTWREQVEGEMFTGAQLHLDFFPWK